MRIEIISLLAIIIGSVIFNYSLYGESQRLKTKNIELQNTITELEKKMELSNHNAQLMCHPKSHATPKYIDCGESFSPRFATCICTTMCLEGYSMTYTDRSMMDCNDWFDPKQKIKVGPVKR